MLRDRFKKFAPYALHLSLIFTVALYVIAGALAIRRIERVAIDNKSTSALDDEDVRTIGLKALIHLQDQSKLCLLNSLSNKILCNNASDQRNQLLQLMENCFESDIVDSFDRNLYNKQEQNNLNNENIEEGYIEWSIMDSLIFCFTVITTIGYGNVTPVTYTGRIFVIVYGLIGIPLTMLAIANLGKFLSTILKKWSYSVTNRCRRVFRSKLFYSKSKEKEALVSNSTQNRESISGENKFADSDEMGTWFDTVILLASFFIYILIGSVVIAAYETEMDLFGAIYFNFVSLTTIGLGDLIPKNEKYLIITMVYCVIGLALTTIAIEISADYLKRLHFFGRKIENVANIQIWFGGKRLTMKQLVRNLGDQFNLPEDQLGKLNLDQFVDDAIKVEAGEMPSLRKRTFFDDSSSLLYMDDDEFYNSSNYSITKI